ncbi:MAG: Gfo/Idh/MocA family oxidoreductase [Pirellulales bacterium]
MTSLRVGLIGCGTVARLHAQRLQADPRGLMALFCDPNRESATRLRDEFAPSAAVEDDLGRALSDHHLDAVVISSPTTVHYEQVCQAMDSGLDVLCEKPLCDRREQIVDLIDRRRRLRRVLAVAYQRRSKSPYLTAKRELAERADWYGPLKQVHVYVCERWQQTIHGTWRDDSRMAAGYFGDAGSHQIDITHFITGRRPEAVLAHSDRRGSRVQIVTQVIAHLTGGAGLTAHFVGDANHWREDVHFHCAEADLLLRSEQLFCAKDNRIEPITDLVPGSSPDSALLDAILDGRPVVSPPEDALAMHDWTEAVLQSAHEGRWVILPTD